MFRHSLLCLVMRSRLSCRAPLSCCGLPCTPLARPSCSALMLSPRCHICHLMRSCLSLDTRPVPLVLLYTRIVGATCIMLKMMLIFCMYSKAPFKNCLRGQAAAHQVIYMNTRLSIDGRNMSKHRFTATGQSREQGGRMLRSSQSSHHSCLLYRPMRHRFPSMRNSNAWSCLANVR